MTSINVIASEAVPEGVGFVVPGPMPTRDTNAADTERWARGVLRLDLSPAEQWYAIRSTPLTPAKR